MILALQGTDPVSGAMAHPQSLGTASESALKRRSRDREPCSPDPVMVTVLRWHTELRQSASMENQFSTKSAFALRFRCLGTTTTKYPKRYRVDLAQAMDPMPELDRRELKALGSAISDSLSKQLGVEVAACSPDVIDTVLDNV